MELLKVMGSGSSYLLFLPVNFPILSKSRDKRPCCLDEIHIKDALLQAETAVAAWDVALGDPLLVGILVGWSKHLGY